MSWPVAAATSCISSSVFGRNSCSGGSSKRIVTGSSPMMLVNLDEILTLDRQQLGQRLAPALRILGHDHLAHRDDAVALEEHVLGAAQADAFGAEAARGARVGRCVGIGAHAHAGAPRRPSP